MRRPPKTKIKNSHFTFILFDVREFNLHRKHSQMLCARRLLQTTYPTAICALCALVDLLGSTFAVENSAERLQTGYRIICICQRKLTAFSINCVYETIRLYSFRRLRWCVTARSVCHLLTIDFDEHEKKYTENKQAICHLIRSVKCHGRTNTKRQRSVSVQEVTVRHRTACIELFAYK